jgi:hypothetical protein
MPVREVWASRSGASTVETRRLVRRQVGLALGILASMWATAWLIEIAVRETANWAVVKLFLAGVGQRQAPQILTVSALLAGLLTLSFVYTCVHIARQLVRRRISAESRAFAERGS